MRITREAYLDWKHSRFKTRKRLLDLADKMDQVHLKSSIAKAAGISIGIIGSVTVFAGVLLAPSTFGLSLSLTVGGTAFGAIGSIGSMWHSIKTDVIMKIICKEAEKILNEDRTQSDGIVELISSSHFRKQMEYGIGSLVGKFGQESLNLANLMSSAISARQSGDTLNASKILLSQSQTIRYLGLSLHLLFLGLEVVRLIELTIEIRDFPRCAYSESIRSILSEFDFNLALLEAHISEIKMIL